MTMLPFNLSKPNRTIRAGVVLVGKYVVTADIAPKEISEGNHSMDSHTELADVAPFDFFNSISKQAVEKIPLSPDHKAQALEFEFYWVSEHGEPASMSVGGSMETISFADCPQLDIVLIGASDTFWKGLSDKEMAFMCKAYEECSAMILICAGYVAAQAAGLLKGKTCTAPRMMIEMLKQTAPETGWIDKRFAHDGKLWTSGALFSGLDCMTAFVKYTWGGEDSLVEALLDICGWPVRSAEYSPGEGLKGIIAQ